MPIILVVEDEADMREVIAYNLGRQGHTVIHAANGFAALARLDEATPDLIVSDIMMPGMDGLQLCAEVRLRPETALTPFLFVTAKTQAEDKYRGLRAGADDYIAKPFELPDLIARVNGRLEHRARLQALDRDLRTGQERLDTSDEPAEMRELRQEQRRLVSELHDGGAVGYCQPPASVAALRAKVARLKERFPALAQRHRTTLIGDSPALLRLFEEIVVAAAGVDPVLIVGDTGTGKTAVAEAIWALSGRTDRPLLTVSCAELAAGDPTIASAKLFGYGKNSGLPNIGREEQPGLLSQADGGVLFLDEVATLPAQAQSLLLLPLEGRPFRPAVGSGSERRVDLKLITATNRDLTAEVEEGRFPRDLYERLAGDVIRMPALAERTEDIPRLAHHFAAQLAVESGGDPPDPALSLTAATIAVLKQYPWPGNVRELRRVVRQAHRRAVVDEAAAIDPAHLPLSVAQTETPTRAPVRPDFSPAGTTAGPDSDFTTRERAEIEALRETRFRISAAETLLGYSQRSRTLSHRLRGMGFKALSLAAWDVERAAVLIAGEDAELRAQMARRLRAQLDNLASASSDGQPPAKLLAHLLAEHRPYAVEAVERLRRNPTM